MSTPLAPGTVRVGNLRKGSVLKPQPGETAVVVDRTHRILGNQHVLRDQHDAAARDRVILAYQKDYDQDLAINGPMAKATAMLASRVRRGENIMLMCWCAPLPCHATCIEAGILRMLANPPL